MSNNMAIQTNMLALNAHRNGKMTGDMQEKASARLSSGFRINSAADDAAGLAISEKMRAQIRGLDQASRNTQDAISLVQTAEGGMQEIDNMIQRMRELVVQASNDTNEQSTDVDNSPFGDRQKIQDEINQLAQEIDNMANRVEFNKKKVINGDFGKGTNQEKIEYKQALSDLNDKKSAFYTQFESDIESLVKAAKAEVVPGNNADELAMAKINDSVDKMKELFAKVKLTDDTASLAQIATDIIAEATAIATAGAATGVTGALKTEADNIEAAFKTGAGSTALLEALSATGAESDLYAAAKSAVTNSTTEGLYFQVGANSNQSIEVSINAVTTDMLGIGDGNGHTGIDVVRASGKQITEYLDTLDKALNYVTTERAKLGAVQNRLDYTNRSLEISSENLTASESRIRDADMAKEMMALTKANVLQNAAVSMMSQANQNSQNVLQLLR